MCLGRRPIPIGAEIARSTIEEAGKVAIGPSAAASRRHTFASLRSCSLAAFIHAFAELPLLTWPHLAQPLLRTADPAGDSLFSSPLGSTVVASQLRSGMRGVSKNRERLAPGSIPAHADPCGDYRQQRHGKYTPQVRHSYATTADCTPSCLQSMSL